MAENKKKTFPDDTVLSADSCYDTVVLLLIDAGKLSATSVFVSTRPCRLGCSDAPSAAPSARAPAAAGAAAAARRPLRSEVGTAGVAARPKGSAGVDRAQAGAEKSGRQPDQRSQRARRRRYLTDCLRKTSGQCNLSQGRIAAAAKMHPVYHRTHNATRAGKVCKHL